MSRSMIRKLGLSVTAAAVVAAGAVGVTYAATTTTVVYACASANGTLRLLSRGVCSNGYRKVAINKQGPRGLTGPRGLQGVAGPGALPLRAFSTTSTTNFQDVPVAGTGLTVRAICAAADTAAIYITDDSASASYDVAGSYDLTTAGSGHAFFVYNGGSTANLPAGLGPVEFSQPAQQGTSGEIVLSYSGGGGGQLKGDVAVRRAGKTFLIDFYLYLATDHCFVQGAVTPTG